MSSDELFDPARLNEWLSIDLVSGKKNVLEILDVFFTAAEQEFEQISRAFQARSDSSACQRIAHNLKSTYAHVGALRLCGLFQDLETAFGSGDWNKAEKLMAELETKRGMTHRLIENYRESL